MYFIRTLKDINSLLLIKDLFDLSFLYLEKTIMKKLLFILLFTSISYSQSWKYSTFESDFDGSYKLARVYGTGGEFPYKNPDLVVLRYSTGSINIYISDAGYSGCDNKKVKFKFNNDDEIYTTSSVGGGANNDSWFINSMNDISERQLLEKFTKHNSVSVRLISNCSSKDYKFSLSGSTKALNNVLGYGWLKKELEKEEERIKKYKESKRKKEEERIKKHIENKELKRKKDSVKRVEKTEKEEKINEFKKLKDGSIIVGIWYVRIKGLSEFNYQFEIYKNNNKHYGVMISDTLVIKTLTKKGDKYYENNNKYGKYYTIKGSKGSKGSLWFYDKEGLLTDRFGVSLEK